ncbi:MAG: transposase [Saprospiraceae bacterium]|nr:transposase [Saprospiraceae bacterium]
MKSSKFTESQIIKALKENENGKTAEQISRELGINKATFYNWRKQYGGMEVSQLKSLRSFRRNAKLKRMYADQALMLEMAKDVISKSGKAFRQKNDRNLPCEKI